MATSANVVGLEGANTMFATVSQIQDGPKLQRLLLNAIVFFYLQNPVKQNLDLKRSERRPTGGKVARDGHVSERSRAGRSKHDVCDCKPNPRWPKMRICNFKIVNPFFMSFSTKCVIIKQNKEVQNAIRSFGKTD